MFGKRTDDSQSKAGAPPIVQPGSVPAALAAPPSTIPDLPLPSSGGFGAQSTQGGNGNAQPVP
ncbi:MAG: hypothetical protein ACREDX_10035, partial [Aestuariivirga sp.]